MEKVYIVMIENVMDFQKDITFKVFGKYGDAKDYKDKLVNQLEDVSAYDTIQDEINYFECYNDGYYDEDHYSIDIIEQEVR